MTDTNKPKDKKVITTSNLNFLAFKKLAAGTNVNENTLLATDYLNHFNEIVMLLEMVPDMPEILEDVKEWQPKSYVAHFHVSAIADTALAIAAYDFVPTEFKEPFEANINQMNQLVAISIVKLEADLATGNMDMVRENAGTYSLQMQKLIDVAGGIIHGSQTVKSQQTDIDTLLGF